MAGATLHATCVIVGEAGLLIRGDAGAGKSSLARALLAEGARRGIFARLVGDDRIIVEAVAGRLLARGHHAIAGLIETRGLGLVREPTEAACVLRLIVDLTKESAPRLPDEADLSAGIEGVRLPRLAIGLGADPQALVFAALIRLD